MCHMAFTLAGPSHHFCQNGPGDRSFLTLVADKHDWLDPVCSRVSVIIPRNEAPNRLEQRSKDIPTRSRRCAVARRPVARRAGGRRR